MSAATSSSTTHPPGCQVILTLAHLLQQHSLSYDDEKDILIDSSVKRALRIANQGRGEGGDAEAEVHIVLTGSPRPTFAETNAWLLEGQSQGHQAAAPTTPKRMNNENDNNGDENRAAVDATPTGSTPVSFRGSYSILDNNVQMMSRDDDDASMDSNDEGGGTSGAELLQEYIAECTHNSSTRNANMDDLGGSPTRVGGSVLGRYRERKYSHGDVSAGGVAENNNQNECSHTNLESNNGNSTINDNSNDEKGSSSIGPMVGQAVVNAISQAHGVGLQSSRARLLQGTIDRPLWDQRRWTDGECLFSELVERCGLESFANVGVAVAHIGGGVSRRGGADDAAGGGERPSMLGTAGLGLQKTTNLLAHLITVPTPITTGKNADAGGEVLGMEEDTIEEIARGILRCLKRKKSTPASKVYLVLPPDSSSEEGDQERKQVALARLAAAWQKLERFNDMIGAPKLMSNAQFDFIDASV